MTERVIEKNEKSSNGGGELTLAELLAAGNHVLSVMNHTGDTRTLWKLGDPETEAEAKAIFDRLTKEGCFAFATTTSETGEMTGDQLKEFDPAAKHIVLARPLQGG